VKSKAIGKKTESDRLATPGPKDSTASNELQKRMKKIAPDRAKKYRQSSGE